MNINVPYYLVMAIIMAVFAFNGCSDSSTSSADSCVISLPAELAPVMFENTYFQNQDIPFEEQYMTYKEVESYATLGAALMSTMGPLGIGSSFLMLIQATGITPTIDGNTCNWTFQIPAGIEGGGGSVTILGTPANNGVNWEVLLTEAGSSTSIPVLRGFTATDNRSGEWRIFDESSSTSPAIVYSWQIQSATNYSTTVTSTDSGLSYLNYERNGPENFLVSSDNQQEINVYWNENTDSGWIEDNDGRRCYTNFVNSSC